MKTYSTFAILIINNLVNYSIANLCIVTYYLLKSDTTIYLKYQEISEWQLVHTSES